VDVADTGCAGRDGWRPGVRASDAPVIVPPQAHATRTRHWPPALRRAHAALRPIIAPVNDRLLETGGLEHERPQERQGLRARLAAKVGLHTFCLWLTIPLGRPPLAFADLVAW
jgi:hypothetical protein